MFIKATVACVTRRGVLLLVLLVASPALAGDDGSEIRAVGGVLAPFVMGGPGQLTGFSVDLWNEIVATMKARTSYRTVANMAELLQSLRSGEADIAINGAFYTVERDQEFDFSYPILNAGQLVMVRTAPTGAESSPLRSFLKILLSRSMLYWLGAALLLILVPAHLIWLLDRRSEPSISQSEKYFPGIVHTMAWAAEAMFSQAGVMPRQRLAHLFAILWLFTSVVFVAFFTAQLTASLTVEEIRGVINGPDDLPGKKVATLSGSTSADYLREIGAQVREVANPEDMFSVLLAGKVDAVVLAAPVLRYYAAHQGAGKVKLVGREFRKSNLAFLIPLNSPLRRRVDSALVVLLNNGTYERLYEKWFGKE